MGKSIAFGFALLIGLLLVAGCAADGNSSDNDRSNGFYGGATGGGSRP